MKRTVKSASDLKRLALQQGAAVEIGDRRFNSDMERVAATKPLPPPPPAPKPEIKPEPKPEPRLDPIVHTEQVQVNMDMLPVAQAVERGNERVAEVIKESLRQASVQTNSSQPTSWLFTIKRDTRGFIESVEANPQPLPKK